MAVVRQWCGSGAAVVRQWCGSGAAVVRQWCGSGEIMSDVPGGEFGKIVVRLDRYKVP